MSKSQLTKQDVLTTEQAAKLLSLNASTVVSWANTRGLKVYRTPGGHRRILIKDLLDFLDSYDMPVCSALQEAADAV